MAASWSWPTAAASGACASAGIRGRSRRSGFSASTRSSSCPRRRDSRALVAERGAPIKALLLDQTFAAGVGNWIADEVLYQARIAPGRRAGSLSRQEADRLRLAIKRVVGTAVKLNSDSDRYPKSWLFHHRWGRNAAAVTARGERIRHDTIGGRTTAWVPTVQR